MSRDEDSNEVCGDKLKVSDSKTFSSVPWLKLRCSNNHLDFETRWLDEMLNLEHS